MNKQKIILILFIFLSCSTVPLPYNVEIKDTLTAEEHDDLGVIYEEKKELDLAESEYKKAIKKNATWAIPYFHLGNIYYKKGKYDFSEIYYKKAIELDNHYADCLNNLAYLLYEQKRYQEALENINKALNIERKKEYLDTKKVIMDKL